MPVRSLDGSVFRWPDAETVRRAVADWAHTEAAARPQVVRIGYFGSYARGDWGVGSDLDLVVVLQDSDQPFTQRGRDWDVTKLPVPADLLVYTMHELESIMSGGGRFARTLEDEAVWLVDRSSHP